MYSEVSSTPDRSMKSGRSSRTNSVSQFGNVSKRSFKKQNALVRLGILDVSGNVKDEIKTACKALQMQISDFEPKSFDEILKK